MHYIVDNEIKLLKLGLASDFDNLNKTKKSNYL